LDKNAGSDSKGNSLGYRDADSIAAAIEASDSNLKGVNKANNPSVIPYGLPLPDDDEAPESQAPAGPDVAASVVLPRDCSESRDEKAKTEKKQSKYVFIGFFIGFFVVIFFFVKLVMIYVTVIKDMDKQVIEEPSENKMVS